MSFCLHENDVTIVKLIHYTWSKGFFSAKTKIILFVWYAHNNQTLPIVLTSTSNYLSRDGVTTKPKHNININTFTGHIKPWPRLSRNLTGLLETQQPCTRHQIYFCSNGAKNNNTYTILYLVRHTFLKRFESTSL